MVKKKPRWTFCGCYIRCGYRYNNSNGRKKRHKKGASATGKFAKALAKVAEKAVPVIGALLNLTSKLLTLGAKGINFLSNNLWLLAVAITYALYEKRKKHTK